AIRGIRTVVLPPPLPHRARTRAHGDVPTHATPQRWKRARSAYGRPVHTRPWRRVSGTRGRSARPTGSAYRRAWLGSGWDSGYSPPSLAYISAALSAVTFSVVRVVVFLMSFSQSIKIFFARAIA